MSLQSFESLGIIEPILRALKALHYEEPTPIQEKTIPPLLTGRDLIGCAQTGTGKTAAFAIPVLQNLYRARSSARGGHRALHALVLAPTRELAAQDGENFSTYGQFTGLRNTVIFGGVGQKKQTDALSSGVDILVATPGRLIDLMGQGFVSLDEVEFFVLDEADRMLDMGFIHDVRRVVSRLPKQRQTMLFSATMPAAIEKLALEILHDPAEIAAEPVASTVDLIEQSVYLVPKRHKKDLLIHLLKTQPIESALVFSRTKHGANHIVQDLTKNGIRADAIHGNKSQSAREQALSRFKSRQTRVLVATDIAARGLDIDELSHVFNYDLPDTPETYVHRIGRTGRAGQGGTAIAFCDEEERGLLRDIEKLIHKQIPVEKDNPFPLSEEELAAPIQSPRGRGRSGGQQGGRSVGGHFSENRTRRTESGGAGHGRRGRSEPERSNRFSGGRAGWQSDKPGDSRGHRDTMGTGHPRQNGENKPQFSKEWPPHREKRGQSGQRQSGRGRQQAGRFGHGGEGRPEFGADSQPDGAPRGGSSHFGMEPFGGQKKSFSSRGTKTSHGSPFGNRKKRG